jgi:hypothetical protein
VLEPSINEETKEKQNCNSSNILQEIENLNKETKTLSEEKAYLLHIEEQLLLKINEEIYIKRIEREQLKTEIEELKTKCKALTNFLNANTPQQSANLFHDLQGQVGK